jgi:ABC-type nitrate/sulfonate/bicarbonate transport system permease component
MKKSIALSPEGAARPPRFSLPDWTIGVISVLVLLVLWEIGVQAGVLNARNFPPPSRLARSLWALVTDGFPRGITVWLHINATIQRILKGYALASVLAIPLGLVVARSYVLGRISLPVITFARSVATISLLPLAVAWFGVEETTRVLLITYGTFWVILTNVIEGVKQVDPDLIRAAQTLGATRRQIFYRVILPASLPRIFAGMKVALGLAFLVIVAVEMIGTIQGLGALIMQSRTYYRSDIAMVGMIFMALFGFALAKTLDWVERLLLPWATGLEEVER